MLTNDNNLHNPDQSQVATDTLHIIGMYDGD